MLATVRTWAKRSIYIVGLYGEFPKPNGSMTARIMALKRYLKFNIVSKP
jgi:hypothetical protein